MHDNEVRKRKGGAQPGAGRPVGSGKYGEPTVPVRIPLSLLAKVRSLIDQHLKLPPMKNNINYEGK